MFHLVCDVIVPDRDRKTRRNQTASNPFIAKTFMNILAIAPYERDFAAIGRNVVLFIAPPGRSDAGSGYPLPVPDGFLWRTANFLMATGVET